MKKSLLKSVKEHECQGVQKEKALLSNLSALDYVLKDVYETCCPTSKDYDKRRDLIRVFNDIARELYGDDNCPVVEEFGSFLMDMFNSSSDLDLSINFSYEPVMDRRSMQTQTLRKFAKKLYEMCDRGHVTNVRPVLSARVPVLKVTDCWSGVECDLSVGNLDGIAKSQIVLLVSSIDERFQKLCFLMKAWAKAQHINSAVDGSLNSLSLILLAAFHLQTRDTPILPPFSAILKDGTDIDTVKKSITTFMNYGKNNKESLAELFVSLLVKLDSVDALWSEGLCASTFEGSWIHKIWSTKKKNGPEHGCISIEDFSDRSQNTSRALKKFLTHMKIYSCIHFSLNKIRLFTEGKINAVKLKRLLFGEDPTATSKASAPANHHTMCTQGKRKRPSEKQKTQPPLGASSKRQKVQSSGNVTSTSGRKEKLQKTLSAPQPLPLPTQTIQGSQFDALGLAALTLLAGQLISTPNSSTQVFGGIRPESGQIHPLHNSHPPFQDSRGFTPGRTHAEHSGHAGPTFIAGQQLPGPFLPTRGPIRPERTHVEDLSFQGHGGFRPQRTHAEGFSHAGTRFPVSQPSPPFSDRPNQSYDGGYRMEDTYRHANSWDSRSYSTMPSYHPHRPSPPCADPIRWERPYAPWPPYPLVPSQYPNNTHEYENRHGFR